MSARSYLIPFEPHSWQLGFIHHSKLPKYRIPLGNFPTPIQTFALFQNLTEENPLDLQFYIKRDDCTSFDLSGNKVRKLEFLLADAIDQNCDSVITIGGLQSNHARATAIASKQLGLNPHLILRTEKSLEDIDLTGNLLFNQMVGSYIYTVSPGTYAQIGSDSLVSQLNLQLADQGKNPYSIPVGGSNTLGSFGYMETMQEIMTYGVEFEHIIFATGSGGTMAGIAIGAKLAGLKSKLHAIGVCDNPDYFYRHLEDVVDDLCISREIFGNPRDWIDVYNGQGIGYSKSTQQELEFIAKVAQNTGILLDPVYSGKALYHFIQNIVNTHSEKFQKHDKILFIHTGGVFGLYDKAKQLLPLLPSDRVTKMKVSLIK